MCLLISWGEKKVKGRSQEGSDNYKAKKSFKILPSVHAPALEALN